MDYSPFNTTVWILFAAFAVLVWGVTRVFSARHPGYPGNKPGTPTEDAPGT